MIIEKEEQNIIKSILNVRCRDGATIADIESDYEEIVGKPLMDSYNFLNSMDCVYCIKSPNGEQKWYANSNNMQHITKFILEQRIVQKPKPQKILNGSIKGNDCFFKDNIIYRHMRKNNHNHTFTSATHFLEDISNNNFTYQKSVSTPTSPKSPKRPQPKLDAQLVGDDFFRMLVARDSLSQMFHRNNGVQQTGLCVSGLSISAATKLVELAIYFKSEHLILNVGSVDILHGHLLSEMCIDFERLIRACEQRGLKPIITTLAPLANGSHSPENRQTLLKFNQFLLNKYDTMYSIIDIYSQMVNPIGHTDFDCFECDSIYVSGSNRPHVMWSQSGRTKIRIHILSRLNQILKKNERSERLYFGA